MKSRLTAGLAVLTLAMALALVPVAPAQAAQLASFKAQSLDPRASVTNGVRLYMTGVNTTAHISCLQATFSSGINKTGTAGITSATNWQNTLTDGDEDQWVTNTSGGGASPLVMSYHDTSGFQYEMLNASGFWTITGTNVSTPGTYWVTFETFTGADCSTGLTDTAQAAFVVTPSNVASVTIDPTMTFSVAGANANCNGLTNTIAANATSTAVPLGHLSSGTRAVGVQNLSVTTNAGGGFVVNVRSASVTSPVMTGAASHAIADVSAGTAPAATTSAFGFTTGDIGVAMTSGNVAPVPNASGNTPVMSAASPVSARTSCVGFMASVSVTTPADTYATTIIYTAVPTF